MPTDPAPAWSYGKTVVAVLLAGLILACLALVVVDSWPLTPVSSQTSPTSDKETIFKDKLDGYGKRADDLQKMATLILGLSTIYAIALGLSAYTSVQANLEQAEKSVSKADQSLAKLESLAQEFQVQKNAELEKLRKAAVDIDDKTTYATRVAIATMVSNFPLEEDVVDRLRQDSIRGLLDLKNGNYATDEFVNLRLARLYRKSKLLLRAEEVLTTFIEQKESKSQGNDLAAEKAYYNRACYQALRCNRQPGTKKCSFCGNSEGSRPRHSFERAKQKGRGRRPRFQGRIE